MLPLEKAKRTRRYDFLGRHRRCITNGELGLPKAEIYIMTKALGILRDVIGKGICGPPDPAHHKYEYLEEKSYLDQHFRQQGRVSVVGGLCAARSRPSWTGTCQRRLAEECGIGAETSKDSKESRQRNRIIEDIHMFKKTKLVPVDGNIPVELTTEASLRTAEVRNSRKRAAEDIEPLETVRMFEKACSHQDELPEETLLGLRQLKAKGIPRVKSGRRMWRLRVLQRF